MTGVTTGRVGDLPHVVLYDEDETDVALDFLTPDQARRLAVKLIETAHQIDKPNTAPEWP